MLTNTLSNRVYASHASVTFSTQTTMSNSTIHPALEQLRAALVGRVCTGGICQVIHENLGLYYRKTNEKEATLVP